MAWFKTKLFIAASLTCSVLAHSRPSLAAAEPGTTAFLKAFVYGCVVNSGDFSKVRDYAKEQKFKEVALEGPLRQMLVGGGDGTAWDLPRVNGKIFTLVIQDKPETCAVWVEAINSDEIQFYFRSMRADLEKQGLTARIEQDDPLKTQTGFGRLIVISSLSKEFGSYLYTLAIADKTGSLKTNTPFQAALELKPLK